ncbi:DUF4265 domain-containing protein [Nevskia sp.]|uniref:DUF4265 domain-containing protein n=1 Tax=Nevskia sp. TaxID=1929292 RepID=UPI0025D16BD5|nr:DUF4265 domain-containing protein [Nevskia sp.]
MSTSHPDLAKVLFRVRDESEVEALWAKPVGLDLYELDNSPFYAYGVSWKDVVLAPYSPADGMAVFQAIAKKSGHRTIRVALEFPYEAGNQSAAEIDALVDMGCSFEGSNRCLMSVDIPPTVDLGSIRDRLIDRGLKWEYGDPTYEELFPEL